MSENSGDTVIPRIKTVQLHSLKNKYAFFTPKTCTFPHYQSLLCDVWTCARIIIHKRCKRNEESEKT